MVAGPTRPPSGGISTVLNDMMASSLGNKVDFVLLDNSKRTPPDRGLLQGIRSQLAIMREYVHMIREEKPDLVHIHSGGNLDFYRKSLDVLLARLFRTKVVFHNKGGDFNLFVENRTFLGRAYVRFILRRCSRVMVLSQWWKDFHSKLIPPDRISVLCNGINSAPYERKMQRNKARYLLRIPKDKVVFLTLGVKGKRKGAYDIVEAAPLVKRMDSSVLFLLVGPDEDIARGATEELAELRTERNVEDVVDMHDEVDEKTRHLLYAAADCFLLPSYAENSPVSIIEAMASKLPVISTTIGAIPELVDHEKTGLLITPGRPGEIAEAVAKLSKDFELRKEMGRAGYRKFRSRYDMERAFVSTLWGIYRGVAASVKAETEPEQRGEDKPEREPPGNVVPDPRQRLEDAADQADSRQ